MVRCAGLEARCYSHNATTDSYPGIPACTPSAGTHLNDAVTASPHFWFHFIRVFNRYQSTPMDPEVWGRQKLPLEEIVARLPVEVRSRFCSVRRHSWRSDILATEAKALQMSRDAAACRQIVLDAAARKEIVVFGVLSTRQHLPHAIGPRCVPDRWCEPCFLQGDWCQ